MRKTFFLSLILLFITSARAQSSADYEHEFIYKPTTTIKNAVVAGDFNNWSQDANPLKPSDDGTWRTKIPLTEGIHQYKFIIDGQWLNDPQADKSLEQDDNHGGKNSAVYIGVDARKLPPPKPNDVNAKGVLHDPNDSRDCDVFANGSILLALRTQADDVQSVALSWTDADAKDPTIENHVPMVKIGSKNGFDRWEVALYNLQPHAISYTFELTDGDKTFLLDSKTLQSKSTGGGNPVQPFQKNLTAAFTTPDWSKHAIWYQIFPERFRNGDPSNDPADHDYERLVKWTSNWWKAQPGEEPGDENFYKGKGNVWKRRYGGDVQGLIQSLPYLKKLGVNAIYLNPMFEADSMHKYDTTDYRHIDDNFGFKGDIAQLQCETDDPSTWQWTKTDKLFLDFVAQAHEQGFHVILDGVFNHVGRSFWAFQDVLKNGKNSKYADWFDIRDWTPPIKYIAWDTGAEATDHGALPVFKKTAARGLADGPRAHIFAITKRWLAPNGDPTKGVDGFRLDVPGDIPHPFWIDWRKLVKQTNPDAYITGEIWEWAQPWLQGDQFDAVMNYRWADAAQKFFVNRDKALRPSEFNQYLSEIAYNYPFQIALAQQNLFDSHDTDRFASMFVNPDQAYDASNRIQDNNPKYNPTKPTPPMYQRMRQAVACQMGFVGAPMIYYGDETGMWGPDDPSNRQPMVWPEMTFDDPQVKFDPEQFAFYQRAIAARRMLEPLQLGFFHAIDIDDANSIYAFERDLGDQHAYVVINRSAQPHSIKLPVTEPANTELVNWLDPSDATLENPSTDRPTLKSIKSLAVHDKAVSIKLNAFESAIMSKP